MGSHTEGELILSFHQIPIRKETEEVGPADVALASVPSVLNVGRDVGNPLLDGFRKILVGGIAGRRSFDS